MLDLADGIGLRARIKRNQSNGITQSSVLSVTFQSHFSVTLRVLFGNLHRNQIGCMQHYCLQLNEPHAADQQRSS